MSKSQHSKMPPLYLELDVLRALEGGLTISALCIILLRDWIDVATKWVFIIWFVAVYPFILCLRMHVLMLQDLFSVLTTIFFLIMDYLPWFIILVLVICMAVALNLYLFKQRLQRAAIEDLEAEVKWRKREVRMRREAGTETNC
jgi:hypothetical protein